MNQAILFKALQVTNKFRNSKSVLKITSEIVQSILSDNIEYAKYYLDELHRLGIKYTYPGHESYPKLFYKMLEPPLFLEYFGEPVWMTYDILSVVGSRKIHTFTQSWMQTELALFLEEKTNIAIASGGAVGVDQCAHWMSIKASRPTIVILPCGLTKLFPQNLDKLKNYILENGGCLMSEFSYDQQVRKQFFYFRNRLIAALAKVILIAQAERKSGSFLTVHHALQNGRTLVTLPAHPEMSDFSGNLHLMGEGCFHVFTNKDMLNLWEAET